MYFPFFTLSTIKAILSGLGPPEKERISTVKSSPESKRRKLVLLAGNCRKEKEELAGKSLIVFPEEREMVTKGKIKATVL